MKFIDSTRIAELALRAAENPEVHLQVVYCPEKLVRELQLSPEEAHVVRTGDLSKVDLDDETLEKARAMFEPPKAGLADVRSSYRVWGRFADIRSSPICT
jgi:hypothetical protein